MSIWKKAFWKDAAERTISAVAQALLLFWFGEALPDSIVQVNVDFADWRAWGQIVLAAAVLQMLKNLVAVLKNPNNGASFGTTNPADMVEALVTAKTVTTGVYGSGRTVAAPGDTVAGKASPIETDQPVQVSPLPPVETVGTE